RPTLGVPMTIIIAPNNSSQPLGRRGGEYLVDPNLVVVRQGHNSRFDFGDLDALAELIADQHDKDGIGVRRALSVRRHPEKAGYYELISGERRLRAVLLLIKKGREFSRGIPVRIADKNITELEMELEDIADNVSGKALLPLEEAYAFKRLQDRGLTHAQIA